MRPLRLRFERRRLEAPVFVVGCCNSGTTILREALRAHPDLAGPPMEGQNLVDLPPALRHFLGTQTFRMFAHPRFREAYRLTENHLEARLADRIDAVYAEHGVSGRRFIEKSPANSLRTRFLQAIYPDACFVVVVRHGLAVSEGICRKRWFDPERPQMAGLQTALTDAAKQWFHANYSLLRDFAYLRKAVLVRYEDLVADPAVTLARVTRACGLAPRKFPVPVFDLDRNARQLASLSSEERAEVVGLLVKESRKMRGGSAILRFLERRP